MNTANTLRPLATFVGLVSLSITALPTLVVIAVSGLLVLPFVLPFGLLCARGISWFPRPPPVNELDAT